ncbi:hypothetical protein SY83_13480 [Paenibacillus swuensis]|uniref:Tryptophan synthase beta chain-like PALP domain-containing protein n=1 Tax=Paenibacillus swuensis TaxID=1178515 RepID=A0A172TJ67_9BACL|nr:pyridoxal-phosphate dependent enzyme [Paenibacillus swuensis]ANE47105.1 hypothetical protein SY83_13480 [Paenibacillus swuensis]
MNVISRKIKSLQCTECGSEYELGPIYGGCTNCRSQGKSGALEVHYDLDAVKLSRDWLDGGVRSIWEYRQLLPVEDPNCFLSLGEGNTPLTNDSYYDQQYGMPHVYLKNEGFNPTWSHKDRLNVVLVSKTKELKGTGIATSSTGNQGISAAAYAAAAGLPSYVFYPPETASIYHRLTGMYGGKAVVTPWESRGKLLRKLVEDHGFTPSYPLVDGELSNPYGIEGYKTVAYELVRQLGGVPDYILAPVSEGNALTGMWKGFNELLQLGLTDKLPRLYGCQAAGADALVQSLHQGDEKVKVLDEAYSLATSTRERTAGVHVLRSIRASGGGAFAVSDRQIQDTMIALGKRGYCVESASAIPVACLEQLFQEGKVRPEDKIVCLITSAGLKWPDLIAELAPPPLRIEGNWESFSRETGL